MKAILLAIQLVLISGCCTGGPAILNIWVTAPSTDNTCNWDVVVWGGATEVTQGDSVLVVYQSGDTVQTAVELYDGDQRIALEETTREAKCDNGCGSRRTWYRIAVPPGEYTLVHRESAGTGKPVHTPGAVSEDPWTIYAGERALVSTLLVTIASE